MKFWWNFYIAFTSTKGLFAERVRVGNKRKTFITINQVFPHFKMVTGRSGSGRLGSGRSGSGDWGAEDRGAEDRGAEDWRAEDYLYWKLNTSTMVICLGFILSVKLTNSCCCWFPLLMWFSNCCSFYPIDVKCDFIFLNCCTIIDC